MDSSLDDRIYALLDILGESTYVSVIVWSQSMEISSSYFLELSWDPRYWCM